MELQTNFVEEIFDKIRIDSNGHRIEALYNGSLSEKDIINLCGGIPTKDIKSLILDIQCEKSGVYEVFIIADKFYVSRGIDFNAKVIFNHSMRIPEGYQKNGLGRNLLINQIISARIFTFNSLNAIAGANNMNGFYTWGRLGYTMWYSYREKFSELLRTNHRKEESLFQLLKTEDGKNFWMKNGFTWNATFFIKI